MVSTESSEIITAAIVKNTFVRLLLFLVVYLPKYFQKSMVKTTSLLIQTYSFIGVLQNNHRITTKTLVSDLRSETKGSRFESGCQLCAEVSSLQQSPG